MNGDPPMSLGAKVIDFLKHSDTAAAPPIEAKDAPDDALAFDDTDIANTKRLVRRHGYNLKFTPERGWLVWDGRRWAPDDKMIQLQAMAKETALSIFDEIRNAPDERPGCVTRSAVRARQPSKR